MANDARDVRLENAALCAAGKLVGRAGLRAWYNEEHAKKPSRDEAMATLPLASTRPMYDRSAVYGASRHAPDVHEPERVREVGAEEDPREHRERAARRDDRGRAPRGGGPRHPARPRRAGTTVSRETSAHDGLRSRRSTSRRSDYDDQADSSPEELRSSAERPSARDARRDAASVSHRRRHHTYDLPLDNAERARLQREPVHVPMPVQAILCAVAVVALAVVMLWGPFGEWYVAWRTNEQLTQEYAAVAEKNASLSSEAEDLLSEGGIKDHARSLGYVEEGETHVVVTGANAQEGASEDGTASEAAEPWYIQLLDSAFGYQPE